jgi:hypothetical protein
MNETVVSIVSFAGLPVNIYTASISIGVSTRFLPSQYQHARGQLSRVYSGYSLQSTLPTPTVKTPGAMAGFNCYTCSYMLSAHSVRPTARVV